MNKKRILVAEESKDLYALLGSAHTMYEIAYANNGKKALEKISSFVPDLVITSLMLPGMDGIEFLRILRAQMGEVGVIIASYQSMIQSYYAAMLHGVNYFLIQPCSKEKLLTLCRQFFSGTLHPDSFRPHLPHYNKKKNPLYVPQAKLPNRYLRFWGTRGSTPISGGDSLRFGGNTSCLELCVDNECILLDAGSGLRPFGETMSQDIRKIHLFLGHTHWDHILGFPFFTPLYDKKIHLSIWAPVGYEKGPKELFVEMLAYAYFPIRLEDIRAKITFHELRDSQTIDIGPVQLQTHYAFHPGATLCFKIQIGKTKLAYVSDNEMLLGYHGHPNAIAQDHKLLHPYLSLIKFLKGVDILIHEAQYNPSEYKQKVGWGHSSLSNAAVLIQYCKPKEWIVTHHDPAHNDQYLQEHFEMILSVLKECHVPCSVHMAYDGFILPIS